MAMRLQRVHAEFGGKHEGLLVVGFGLFEGLAIAMSVNVAEEAKSPGLVSSLFPGT
jgi:hypothetical protein